MGTSREKRELIESANKKLLAENTCEEDDVVSALASTMYMMSMVLDMVIDSAEQEGLSVSDGLKMNGYDMVSDLQGLKTDLDNIADDVCGKGDLLGMYQEIVGKLN